MGLDLIPIEIDVYFGMQTDGSAEVSWHTSWWVCTDITFKDLVQKCNNSVMEEYPDTNLLEYTLIINMASGAVVNETNIGAVMRTAKARGDKFMPLYNRTRFSLACAPI